MAIAALAIGGAAQTLVAVEGGKESTPNHCNAVTIEVAGVSYGGKMVECMQVQATGGIIKGSVGDGPWPPVGLQFPIVRRGSELMIRVALEPGSDLHLDVYPWPLSEDDKYDPGICTTVIGAVQTSWPVDLPSGQYVVVLTGCWDGSRGSRRAFGLEVAQ